jgi:5,10-methylenetetrahydromethanopterin reductase
MILLARSRDCSCRAATFEVQFLGIFWAVRRWDQTMQKLGLGLMGEPDAVEMARLAGLAEEAGFESIWLAETRFMRDAITSATAVALATSTVQVGTAAINVFTRGAVLTAVTFAALDELSGGRAVLGIGAGSDHVLAAQGYEFDRPLWRLREQVAAIRAVWRGEDFQGEFVRIEGVRLDFTPPRAEVPIYLAVSGPRSLVFAGEAADGVILDVCAPVEYVKQAARAVTDAAREAGREPGAVEIAGVVLTALDDEERAGRSRVAPIVATYLTRFPTLAGVVGLQREEIDRYVALAESEGIDAVTVALSDEVVDRLSVNGSPAQCRERIAAYRSAGLGLPILVSPSDQLAAVIDAVGPGPAVPADRVGSP